MTSTPDIEVFGHQLRDAADRRIRAERAARRQRRLATLAISSTAVVIAAVVLAIPGPDGTASAAARTYKALDPGKGAVGITYRQQEFRGSRQIRSARVVIWRSRDAVHTTVTMPGAVKEWAVHPTSWRMYDSAANTTTVVRWHRPKSIAVSASELDPFERFRRLHQQGALSESAAPESPTSILLSKTTPDTSFRFTVRRGTGRPVSLETRHGNEVVRLTFTRYERAADPAVARGKLALGEHPASRIVELPAS